ncbi:hypothetical protein ACFSCW_04305 [Sphingomonas tabacisoli]|uniref:Uncharacterized protein n=1 Tax=Sphingomonas tabacisoli TaxID=2249466 RepID=A0ABW4HZI2_9SPHN
MLLHVVTSLLLAAAPEAAPAAQAPATPAEKPVEKKVCRTQIETGSLVKGKKICMTVKQWQKVSDASRDEFDSRTSSGSSSGQ